MLLTVVTFFLILSVLVFVHEFGHFWVARRFGIKPEEFGFGFPPRVFGVYRSRDGGWKKVAGGREPDDAADTIYSVNWVPIGGFVKLGEDDITSSDPNHFINKKIWQRMAIIMAGVTMNVILAAFLISAGYAVGLPQALDNLSPGAKVTDRQVQVVDIVPGSPAAGADIEAGDIIMAADGNAITSSEELQAFVDSHIGQSIDIAVRRDKEAMNIAVIPEVMAETGKGGIGVGIIDTGVVKYPLYLAAWEGVKSTISLFISIVVAFFSIIGGIFAGRGVGADLAGPVGIAVLTGQVARLGFVYIMQFAAILSVNLAIINAFPFPALDGGRFIFLIIEKIIGRPVKKSVEAIIHNVGFALLMLLVVMVTYRDLARYGGDFFAQFWHKIMG
jgi:regulator of sigma E protease